MQENNKKKQIFLDVDGVVLDEPMTEEIRALLLKKPENLDEFKQIIKKQLDWLFEYIDKLKADGFNVILRSGSNRQTFNIEYLNSMVSGNWKYKIPSYILLPIIADMAEVNFNPVLISDRVPQEPKELHEGLKIFARAAGVSEKDIKSQGLKDLAYLTLANWLNKSGKLFTEVGAACGKSNFAFNDKGINEDNKSYIFEYAKSAAVSPDPTTESWVFIDDKKHILKNTADSLASANMPVSIELFHFSDKNMELFSTVSAVIKKSDQQDEIVTNAPKETLDITSNNSNPRVVIKLPKGAEIDINEDEFIASAEEKEKKGVSEFFKKIRRKFPGEKKKAAIDEVLDIKRP